MRYLLRMRPRSPQAGELLATARAVAGSMGVEVRNPKRTSTGTLEVDVFAPGRADLDTLLAALGPLAVVESARDLNVAPPHRSRGQLFSEARGLFNSERYWECHEVLEEAWRTSSGEEKSRLQGLILVCAAFVHHQKGEDGVALGVLKRAIPKLDFPEASYNGLDVASMKRLAVEMASSGEFAPFAV